MTIYYLMVKTHNITGLKYLCQTKRKDPLKYLGSGLHWGRHLAIHGKAITTLILKECSSIEEIKEYGLYYSELWNIVDSDEWANLKPEDGQGWGEGEHHPMRDPTIRAKIQGDNNYQRKPDYSCSQTTIDKISGQNHYKRRPGYIPIEVSQATKSKMSADHWTKQPNAGEVKSKVSVKNNYQYNPTIYCFHNTISGEIIKMTRSEFKNYTNMPNNPLGALINNKKYKGWKILDTPPNDVDI